ncbi:MAG: DUF3995 domain-containing protein [Elusimicrobiota bacterium]
MMVRLAAVLLIAAFVALAIIHAYWALGGKRGLSVTVPTRDGVPLFKPGPFLTALVAAAFLAAAFLVMGRVHWIGGLPPFCFYWGLWALAVVLLLRAVGDFQSAGLFKRVRDTEFARWDTCFYSPLCLVLASCAFVVARGAP